MTYHLRLEHVMTIDLQDKTRMQDAYKDITLIVDKIGELQVFPPLVWVWTWDVAVTILKDIREGGDPDYCVTMEEEEMWELFFTQADKNGFTLEYGTEDLYEAVRDWMIDQSIIEMIEEEDEDD
jgi:hypothetical protein